MRIVVNVPERDFDIYCRMVDEGMANMAICMIVKGQPLSDILDKISAEIKEKSFTEEIFDEEIFKSTYTENVTRETAEEESVIETEIVKLSDILEIIEKYKEEVSK